MCLPSRLLLAVALLPLAGCASRGMFRILHATHPLAGRVWDVRGQRFADLAELEKAASASDFVLLGETHDNPQDHRLQAEILSSMISSGRRPALAFEMLDKTQQQKVDAALAKAPSDPDALAQAVQWEKSGWPDFSMYRPVFAAGLDARLQIIAANLPPSQVKASVKEGPKALDPEVRSRIEREGPLSPKAHAEMREEMNVSHCGKLPEELFDPMILAQRARDAQMAERLEAADKGQGAVLIAGSGHARNDRGVAWLLSRDEPQKRVLSVAFVEVAPGKDAPADYGSEWGGSLPFDFVVFTPAAEREDPCASIK